MTIGSGFGVADRQQPGIARIGVFDIDGDLGIGICAAHRKAAAAKAVITRARRSPTLIRAFTSAKYRTKEVAEVGGLFGIVRLMKLKTLIPIGRRTEFFAGTVVGAKLIIGGALFRILQHLPGFANLLEAGFRVRLLADVGVILARQLPILALDLIMRRVALYAHQLIVIFEFHGSLLPVPDYRCKNATGPGTLTRLIASP